MTDYTEIEGALKELLKNIELVPGTLPPVYTCDGFVIGFDSQGRLKIHGATPTRANPGESNHQPKRQTGWLGRPAVPPTAQPPQKENWLKRWTGFYGRAIKGANSLKSS